MRTFDSHCHLDMEPLADDYEGAVERATEVGVSGMINVGASMSGSKRSVELANLYPNIWASVGLHPHEAEMILTLEATINELRILAQNDRVIAIGEIGLDYFNDQIPVTKDQKEAQKALFEAQLNLAVELHKPVIIHTRDAWEDTLEGIRHSSFVIGNSGKAPGVIHCFTGSPKQLKPFLELGFYIGFTGFITFKPAKFDSIRESAKAVPLDKILTETDAPFLAPEPHRGKTNEPAYVVEVVRKIADVKNISVEEVAKASVKNTEKVFNIVS